MEQDSEWTSIPTSEPQIDPEPPPGPHSLAQTSSQSRPEVARQLPAHGRKNLKAKKMPVGGASENKTNARVQPSLGPPFRGPTPSEQLGGKRVCSRLTCSALLLATGAISGGAAVWLRHTQLMREQMDLIHKQEESIASLNSQVHHLMNAPVARGVSYSHRSEFIREMYCSEQRAKPEPKTTKTTLPPPQTTTQSGCTRLCEAQSEQRANFFLQEPPRRWAYITMAHTVTNTSEAAGILWSAVAIASALQRLGSKYPLILLTNATTFPDGTPVAAALQRFNVLVQPVYEVRMPANLQKHLLYQKWAIAFWKLQIWALVQWEKLIWLDADSIFYRNPDWLFDRQGMWTQRDDWFCKLKVTKVCSGLMLLYPNVTDYLGLLTYAESMDHMNDGDQQLIQSYFLLKRKITIHYLSDVEAAFGQCLGRTYTPYSNLDGTRVPGMWSIPTFVHKSGGWGNSNGNSYNNLCFTPNISMQLYTVGNATLNVCQYHPLGPYWRSLFCEAVVRIGISLAQVAAYCSDMCFYSGRPLAGSKPAIDPGLCRPVDGTLHVADYYARTVGRPAALAKKVQARRRLLLSGR